jgi:hypothetical protein
MPFKASKAEQPDMPVTDTNKTPSAGTKVKTNAPTVKESAGRVDPDSLAAESQVFLETNRTEIGSTHNQEQNRPQEGADSHASGKSSKKKKKVPKKKGEPLVSKAPTYVQTLYYRDPKGPHGKNIKEDDSIATEDRARNLSLSAEIGSKDDPGLLAEQRLIAGTAAVARSTAPRQRKIEGDIGMYKGLREEEA